MLKAIFILVVLDQLLHPPTTSYAATLSATWQDGTTNKSFDTLSSYINYAVNVTGGTYTSSIVAVTNSTDINSSSAQSGNITILSSSYNYTASGISVGSNSDGSTSNITLNNIILTNYNPMFWGALTSSVNQVNDLSAFTKLPTQPSNNQSINITSNYTGSTPWSRYILYIFSSNRIYSKNNIYWWIF